MSRGEHPFPLVLAAPSGAGKTSIAHRLRERRGDVVFSISATTRPPRAYERPGNDYHFVDEGEFQRMRREGELLEWAPVHGNLYGTPRANVREAQAAGRHLLLDIDVQGAEQIRRALPEAVLVFVLPPSGGDLVERLLHRGSEGREARMRRLLNAREELRAAPDFDYVVVNDDLERAVDDVEAVLDGEPGRMRPAPPLREVVERIRDEIDACLAAEPRGGRGTHETVATEE